MHRTAIPLLFAGLLAACGPSFDRPAFLSKLVGQPEAEVVRRLGVPSRTYETNGRKFLAYVERRADVIASPPLFAGFGYYGAGSGFYSAFPPQIVERGCETTFEVGDGRVLTWSLRGNAC